MSYLVFVTFDLKNASSQNYQDAYSDLDKLGLKRVQKSGEVTSVIPTTAAMGFFDGESASKVCAALRDRVRSAFVARKLKSEIFVVTGGDWAWVASTS